MANSAQRSGTHSQARSPARRPIVLARIPRMGAEAAPPAMTIPMSEPAAIPEPEPMPQLDLQSEIHQQLQLHAPHPPEPRHMHALEQETLAEPLPSLEKRHTSRSRHASDAHRRQADAPAGMSQRVYQLHSQLAPHAGLIVAMALIASAGLLYWMIVGPAHIPALNGPQYGQELGLDGFGASSVQMPSASEQLTTDSETDTWAEVPLPSPEQISSQPPELPQVEPEDRVALPAIEAPALEQLPAVEGLQFPTTSHPEDLNFSRMRPSAPVGDSQPEMAGRSTDSVNR